MKANHESNAYLTFSLGDEKFAIMVDNVQEIVELDMVTKIPNAPHYMLGIINLRGKVLPLLDTKLKLGMPPTEINKKSRIMVLDIEIEDGKNMQIGALVDVAKEVVQISQDEIQDAPDFEDLRTNAPVTGLINNQGDITMIMDITNIFSTSEIMNLKSLN